MSESDLPFTGERFIPSCEREIWYEHYHRYAMAMDWIKGRKVLDAACGEGYGSHLMASQAAAVVGVDVDPEAIAHANKHYRAENLSFQQADALNMDFPDHSFDVVVSFETLEHLAAHDDLLNSFKRVLKPEGVLIISTPDKKEYSDNTGFDNEFHVKELYQHEMESLMTGHFKHLSWYGQKLMFTSAIWQLGGAPESMRFDCMSTDNQLHDKPMFNPMYFIVVASDQPIQGGVDYYEFTEQAEQVYGHYHAVIRAHIKAEQAQLKLEKQQQSWLQHPIIGRCIKWFGKED